ncbi:uncharacterized protein aus isoform X1 [Drosophila pseudoobscura]|uniref:Uncharacterized protein aus isoform X1 n=1 Tax=Drosophila pseudoobscura pseudoobscura TaxID=46245 RepID=A0A6I8VWC1_DROPS|nr:uncharacterized protein LOC4800862 isoform X1 [Drosophila pseudoobscura]
MDYNYNYNYSSSYNNNNKNNNNENSIEQDTAHQEHQHQHQQRQQMQAADRIAAGTSSSSGLSGNTSTSASTSTSTSKTRAGTTSLIYLPPFCYPCKHVPAAGSQCRSQTHSRSHCQTRSDSRRSCHGSCCCQHYWEYKNYDKHASASGLTPATDTDTASATARTTATGTATMSSFSAPSPTRTGKFLQQEEHHGCTDLRQTLQLVVPTVVGGGSRALECGKHRQLEPAAAAAATASDQRCWRRERMRRERPSHASAATLAKVNPISRAAATTLREYNSQATTSTEVATVPRWATTGAELPHDEDAAAGAAAAASTPADDDDDKEEQAKEENDYEYDECRCFNYNGDISLEREKEQQQQQQNGEPQQLASGSGSGSSITWLIFLWQQLVLQANKASSDSRTHSKWAARTTTRSNSMTSTKSWLGPLLMLVLATSVSGWGGRQDAPTNCTFPARWEGSWFLSGYQQSIHIKGSQFSYRGRCTAYDGNKYLIVDEKGCHRCLVIYEKHTNVLQYKESECEGDSMYMHQSNPSALAMRSSNKQSDHRGGAHPNTNGHSRLSSSDQYIMRSNDDMNDCPPDFCKGRETLQNLCDQIPGDALLYSLFRESAEPVKCPLKGPFIFTYNRGHGECKSPVSNIESCTEESRLLLSFQACPDVLGTESTVEELTCLATWKDGNSRYLVGLVSHHHAISNEERYRCFVYEKISALMGNGGPSMLSSKDAEYKLAQSGDATCNGLDSAEVGSRIMSLRKPPVAERCDFPAWFKGPRHWHALMGYAVYNYHPNDGSVHIIKPNGYMETRALCEQINKQTSTEMMAVVHYTTGCQSGFMCMMFYRRDTHVIEIQTGKPAVRLEDACAPDHFDINKMAYITLLASNPEPAICPMEGLYNLRGAIGPPYLATRHKRNHNGKSHLGHGHHHHESADAGTFGHKGRSTLSFRNAEHMERGSWHANTRGLPVRSRRSAPQDPQQQQALVLGNVNSNDTSVGFVATRNRRDVPGCVPNYNAQRQLWVGCSKPNSIDVSPLCSVEGEEEYSCHGSWSENSTFFIIARHKGSKHGVCLTYRPTEGTSAKLVVGDACYRGTQKPPDHHLVANLSVFGKCGETGSSAGDAQLGNWLLLLTMATLQWLYLRS